MFFLITVLQWKWQGTRAETFLISLHPPLPCRGGENADQHDTKKRTDNEQRTVRTNGSFVKHDLLFLPLRKGNTGQLACLVCCFVCWKTGHVTLKVTALWKRFSWHFCDQLKLRKKKKKKEKRPKAVYIHLAIFLASRFLFSAFTPVSLLLLAYNNNNNLFLSLLASAAREKAFDRLNGLWAETQTPVSVKLIEVPLAGWLFYTHSSKRWLISASAELTHK